MNKRLTHRIFLTAVLVLATAGGAWAQIDLRFSPPDTTIEPGDTTRVSIMLDDAVFFRTIELTVTYDSTLVRTAGGGQGTLLSESGLPLVWEGFEEPVPGTWHGFAVIMGATDSLSGPGELFYWDVEGLVEGTTPITSIETKLYEPNAALIADVGLDPTTLRVRWAPTGVADLPRAARRLEIYPNPFNPQTRIGFDLAAAGHVLLSVFDARGRHVATLHDGPSDAGPLRFEWNGKSDSGRSQPGGMYLFRMESTQNGIRQSAVAKGILLK